jgi:hypothetical protein
MTPERISQNNRTSDHKITTLEQSHNLTVSILPGGRTSGDTAIA